jgi:choline dehydrogenase
MGSRTIIVGAGSAGSAAAYRLTDNPEHEVLLVEAGPDYVERDSVPAAVCNAYEMSVEEHDWHLTSFFIEPPEERGPQPYPRGRLVGGSSCVNAAIAQRAAAADLRRWAQMGNDEWSYERVLPYFRALESDLDFGNSDVHSGDGPVPIKRYDRSEWAPAARLFEEELLRRGYPACPDFNAPDATGVGPAPRNQLGEIRASGLLTYIAKARDRSNLSILSGATVRRVLFEGTTAVGIEIERDGQSEQLDADRVVICAGAIHSPQLLVLSGVGPGQVLAELGIEPVVVNDAVGQNFQDHPFVPTLGLLRDPTEYIGVRTELLYSSQLPGGSVNDLMLWASVLDPATLNLDVDTQGRKALTLVTQLAVPNSVGWLTVSSPDVNVQPEIHVNFLSDPEGSDLKRLVKGVRLAFDIATNSPVAGEVDALLFPDADTVGDEDRLAGFIRSIVNTCYHASGTCRLGPDGDPGAVVSQRLAVIGTTNLWVADASVLPTVPTGLTNVSSFMVGERLGHWLRDGGESKPTRAVVTTEA